MTAELGIEHPQEGVLNGHFKPTDEEKAKIIKQLQEGVLLTVKDEKLTPSPARNFTVADMITGYGVSEAINHYYDIYGGSIDAKELLFKDGVMLVLLRLIIKHKSGAKIVGIIDRVGGLIKAEGFLKK